MKNWKPRYWFICGMPFKLADVRFEKHSRPFAVLRSIVFWFVRLSSAGFSSSSYSCLCVRLIAMQFISFKLDFACAQDLLKYFWYWFLSPIKNLRNPRTILFGCTARFTSPLLSFIFRPRITIGRFNENVHKMLNRQTWASNLYRHTHTHNYKEFIVLRSLY